MSAIKIYMDMCCFNRPYDDQTQDIIMLETTAKLMIQQLILDNKLQMIWSYILKYENSKNIFMIRKTAIAGWERACSVFINQNDEIETLAEHIVSKGIKTYDALHLACAIYADCHYFITVDKKLLKYNDDKIVVCNPMQFLSFYGGE